MKKFLKIFFLTILTILVLAAVSFFIFKKTYKPSHLEEQIEAIDVVLEEKEEIEVEIIIPPTEEELWEEKIENSDRVNILLFGTDGMRADTLIFVSYSKEDNDVSMVTVPRDTKNEVEGMNGLGQDKINAVFCFPGDYGGEENQKEAISNILDVPIHYYVKVNYYSLRAIVNIIGGVEVYVHRDMDYDDPYATPELHIHLEEGLQTLNGEQSMEYIRWRKNNDGTGDSDIARTRRQQEFLIKILKKSFGLNIVDVINIGYDYVKTSMTLKDLLYYGTELIGFDLDTINKYSLPGEADNRYFYQDVEKTEDLMKEIYKFDYE